MKRIITFLFFMVSAPCCFSQWEADVRLTDNPYTSDNYSKQGIASFGDTVHVVWYDDRDGNNEIYYKRSLDGGWTWEEDKRLTSTPFNSMYVSIAISGSIVHIAWNDDSDGNWEVYYKNSLDGGDTWEDDIRITDTPGTTQGSSLSVSGSTVYLAYYDYSNNWWEVYLQRSTDEGSTWQPGIQLTDNQAISANPSVCATGPMVYVVWDENWGNNSEIHYKRSVDYGLNWESDIQLTNDDGSESWVPCVAASGSDVYLVWTDNRHGINGFYDEIYYKHAPDEGLTWGTDTRLTNYTGESEFPTMAVAGDGIFIVWEDDRLGNKEIYYKYSMNGGETWEPDKRLTNDPAESSYPSISVAGTQVNVSWIDFRDGNYEIYYKRDPNGNPLAGIRERRAEGIELTVYPNPASTQITVGQVDRWTGGQVAAEQSDVPTLSGSAVRLSIVDLFGREVKEFSEIYSFPHQVDISGLPNSVYLLKIIDDSGNVGSAKFLKINE